MIVGGGIILAEHVPKAIICGADLISIDTSALVALQMKFDGECQLPEKSNMILDEFDDNWGRQRLVNLIGAWHNQILEVLSAMGMRDIRRLRGDTGRAIFKSDIEIYLRNTRSNLRLRGDKFSPINPISCRSDNFTHICPDSVPPLI